MFQLALETRLFTFTAPPHSKPLLQLPSTIAAGDRKPRVAAHKIRIS